jgi:hypothetical protein
MTNQTTKCAWCGQSATGVRPFPGLCDQHKEQAKKANAMPDRQAAAWLAKQP